MAIVAQMSDVTPGHLYKDFVYFTKLCSFSNSTFFGNQMISFIFSTFLISVNVSYLLLVLHLLDFIHLKIIFVAVSLKIV